MISDSEVEVPCANGVKSSHSCEANVMEEDFQEDVASEQPILASAEVVNESERKVASEFNFTDVCDTSLACSGGDDHPDHRIDGDGMEEKESLLTKWTSQHIPVLVSEDSGLKGILFHKPGQLPIMTLLIM